MAKIDVFSPVKGFSGISVGVAFIDGQGEVEKGSAAHKYFLRRGYKFGGVAHSTFDASTASDEPVEQGDDPTTPPEIEIPGMPSSKAKRSEWVEFAEGLGIDTEALTIPQIRERILAEYVTKDGQ